MARTPITPIRLEPEIKAVAIRAAAARGETFSDYVRAAIVERLDAPVPTPDGRAEK